MPDTTICPSERRDDFRSRLLQAMRRKRRPSPAGPDADADAARDAVLQPAGQGDYLVKPGECVSSIAAREGHLWQTIWDEPANAGLRERRGDPNVLATGDRLTIPPLRPKDEHGETDRRHRFVRLGQPTVFRLRLARNGEPIANQPYTIRFDTGREFSCATNDQGRLACPLPIRARRASLCVNTEDGPAEYELDFGHLEPVELLTGVQQRLRHFGYYSGPIDGALTRATVAALKSFQHRHGLPTSGRPDEATRAKLRDEHGA